MFKKHQPYSSYKEQIKNFVSEINKPHHSLGIIYGDSEVLIENVLLYIKKNLSDSQYEITSIEASQWIESEIVLGQNHLFDPQNLYIVNRCESIKSWSQWIKDFLIYKNSISELKDKVILVFKSEKIPESINKDLKKIGFCSISCFDPWPQDFSSAIKDLASRFNLSFTPDAVDALIESNGYDLIKHKHDIGKLALIYAKDLPLKSPLKSSDISTHLGMIRSEEALKLDRFLTAGDWEKAQSLVSNLIGEGEKGLSILGIISYHCRTKIQIEYCRKKTYTIDQISEATGLSTYSIKNSLSMPSKLSIAAYQKALVLCQNADFLMKSTKIVPEILIFEIIDSLAEKHPL
jgi:DNA polymerase III delta subunit